MKRTAILLVLAAGAAALSAQTQPKPATRTTSAAAKPAATATRTASTGKTVPGGPPVIHGIPKTAFSLRYQDIRVGTGPVAEPNKMYSVLYTGWRAADGVKFDSSNDHRQPLMKDGKPVLDADGKPALGEPKPIEFPQGFGRLIPGFDQGFGGMRVGGKRRLFIPWQLGYGTRDVPAHGADHPGIPAKSDLIFDVELVDVKDLPAPPARPAGIQPPHPVPPPAAKPATPAAPAQPAAPATPPAPAAPPQSK